MKSRFVFMTVCIASLVHAQNAPVPTPGNVTLPLDQYNQLVDRAAQIPQMVEGPPVPFVLKNSQMNLQVNGESVSGTVSIEGEVLATNDQKVPLIRGMVVREARQEGRELPVTQAVTQDGPALSALLAGHAPFTVTLDAATPLTIEPGRASFSLPVPQAGSVRLTLSIPGDQTQVNLSPGLITGRSSSGGRTVIEATLVPGEAASVWWAARLTTPQAPAARKEARFLSDVKTLISVSEGELTLVALAEITVVQGEPSQFTVQAPDGFELTGATGSTLASSESQNQSIVLTVNNPVARSHQFLISLARSNMASTAEIPLVTFAGTQRETGEVLVEGNGAMELTATERGVLRRMDLKETSPYLRSLASETLHTAFRYQKKPGETPRVSLAWVRFPNSKMLSAVAQQAVVTTLVTSEGRSLTEVKLTLRNQSQPFLKVELPSGATILSADVAGEKVKPVRGADGNRVPLLRPGFRPADSYTVSFVFLHAGAPFAKKGGAELALPKMDLPIGRVEWEVFLPQQYRVADFGGNALPARLLPLSDVNEAVTPLAAYAQAAGGYFNGGGANGVVVDPTGAVVRGATVIVRNMQTGAQWSAVSDAMGRWMVSGIPSGRIEVSATAPGFKKYIRQLINYDSNVNLREDISLQVGSSAETVTVTNSAPLLKTESGELSRAGVRIEGLEQLPLMTLGTTPPSPNVTDLQRRVAGVLPIAVKVPATGSAYHFVRALATGDETTLTFRYRTK